MSNADDYRLNIRIEASTKTLQKQLNNLQRLVEKSMGASAQATSQLKKEISGLYDNSGGKSYVGLMRESRKVTQKHTTATEQYRLKHERLNEMLKKGLITKKAYRAETVAMRKELSATGNASARAAKSAEYFNRIQKEGSNITRSLRTGTEIYSNEVKRLKVLLSNAAIDQETFNRAVRKARIALVASGGAARQAAQAHRSNTTAIRVQTSAYARLMSKVKGVNTLHIALGATLTGVFAARGVKGYLDDYSSLQSQLRLVAGEHGNVNQLMQKNFDLSKATYSSFSETVNAYARISRSVKQLNKNEKQRLQVVSNINKALSINGSTADQAKASIMQLGQALSSDRFGGDEYRSVSENGQRIIQAIADGLDVSIGKLREMSRAGELTSEVVFNALLSQTSKLNAEFDNIAKRIDQAMMGVSGSMTRTIGELDNVYKISEKVVAGFDGMARAIDAVPANLQTVEIALGAVAGIVTATLIPSIVALGVAALASPLLPLILAGAALGAVYVTIKQVLAGVIDLTDQLNSTDRKLATATDIAADAQRGLTKALRERGLAQADLGASEALQNIADVKNQISKLEGDLWIIPEDVYGGEWIGFNKARKEIQTDIKKSQNELKRAEAQYAAAMKASAIIVHAKIIEVDGGSTLKKAKAGANEVKRVLESIKSPFEKHAVQAKMLKKMRDAGQLTTSQYEKALKLEVDIYHQNVELNKQKSTGYQLQLEANSLLTSSLSSHEQLAKTIERINHLKNQGKLTDEQANNLIVNAKTKFAQKGSGGGSTLTASDGEATGLINKFGSAADRARVAALGYNTEMAKLSRLAREGKIDQITYANAVGDIEAVYGKASAAASDYGRVTQTIMDGVKSSLKDTFNEIFKNGKLTMESLADTINNLLNSVFNKLSGLAIDGVFASFGLGGSPVGKKDGGIVQRFANGGAVRGSGTGRSDSIAAMLSDGEFVVNESATSRHRALLEQINSGNKIAFATPKVANQNINIVHQPIVNMNINIKNAPSNMTVSQNGNNLDIDFIEVIENGIIERMNNGDSNLAQAVAGAL